MIFSSSLLSIAVCSRGLSAFGRKINAALVWVASDAGGEGRGETARPAGFQSRLFGLARVGYTCGDIPNPDDCGKSRMSELSERRWAVLSERGREEAGL